MEVGIKIFEQQQAHQMQEIEKQQVFEDEAQANVLNEIVESLKIVKAIKKDLDLN